MVWYRTQQYQGIELVRKVHNTIEHSFRYKVTDDVRYGTYQYQWVNSES